MNLEALKREAALRAVDRVRSGMRVGLGTGSTALHAIIELGRRIGAGELSRIAGVATSVESERLAREHGIAVEELDARPLDLAIDGADEIAPNLDLIKGAGAALLREKLVALRAAEFIVVADRSKLVGRLGARARLPVEIVRYGHLSTIERLAAFGDPVLRRSGAETVTTDNGNYLVDLKLAGGEPARLAADLKLLPGVVETGLFVGIAARAFVAFEDGVRELVR